MDCTALETPLVSSCKSEREEEGASSCPPLSDEDGHSTTTAHPLCSGWSFLKRQTEVFEPVNGMVLENDTDATLTCSLTLAPKSIEIPKNPSWLSFTSPYQTTPPPPPHLEPYYTPDEMALSQDKPVADLRDSPVWIVTTAALPWMTGTAVNPLLRAAHLLHYRQRRHQYTHSAPVYLVLPWLESPEDRVALYGQDWHDATPETQRNYIVDWLATAANLPEAATALRIEFYPARYHSALSSIFAMGDVLEGLTATSGRDILILEEPEHLNYYRAPTSRDNKFVYTVGIVHTNYRYYAQQHVTGLVTAPLVAAISAGLVRAYCNQVIKLSDILQDYAPHKQIVCNVHGIRHDFLQKDAPTGNKIYFLGKLLWAKGLDHLLMMQHTYRQQTGGFFAMDIYGSGPEEEEIQQAFLGTTEELVTCSTVTNPSSVITSNTTTKGDEKDVFAVSLGKRSFSWSYPTLSTLRRQGALPVKFCGRIDHAALSSEYKIFVNPSISEVLCTVTAEALAMGKFVILPEHPSNNFFRQFLNAKFYAKPLDFVAQLQAALGEDPIPLSLEHRYQLSWEAATERLFEAAAVSEREMARRERLYGREDQRLAELHYELSKGRRGDVLRKVLGGGPVADQVQYQLQRRSDVLAV